MAPKNHFEIKIEYSKKTKFYDEYDNGGYHKKYGGYKGYYGGSKGSKFKGGKDKAGYYGDKYGKKGYDSKGIFFQLIRVKSMFCLYFNF